MLHFKSLPCMSVNRTNKLQSINRAVIPPIYCGVFIYYVAVHRNPCYLAVQRGHYLGAVTPATWQCSECII